MEILASKQHVIKRFSLLQRYDSPEICDLIHSRIGKVPCLSYFETKGRPVKTIEARPSPPESFDSDE